MPATLDDRVSTLEGQVRTWRLVSLAALLAIALLVIFRPRTPDYLGSNSIRLAGPDGEELLLGPGTIKATRGGVQLRFDTESDGDASLSIAPVNADDDVNKNASASATLMPSGLRVQSGTNTARHTTTLDTRGLALVGPDPAGNDRTLASLRYLAETGGTELKLTSQFEKGGTTTLMANELSSSLALHENIVGRSLVAGAGKHQAGIHIEGRDTTATATLRIAGIDPDPDDDVELVLAGGDDIEPLTLTPGEAADADTTGEAADVEHPPADANAPVPDTPSANEPVNE